MIYIRSQNSERIFPTNRPIGVGKENYIVYLDELEDSLGFVLGNYSTEEKAVKVMDMLTDFIGNPPEIIITNNRSGSGG